MPASFLISQTAFTPRALAKFQIDEGTRAAFLEESGRLFLQPVADEFIDNMQGIVAGRNLLNRIEREKDRTID